MSNWANALASAAGAAANVGVEGIDRQLKLQDTIDAEQRAADIKLSTQERMLAIEEAAKTRAAERYAAVYQQKLGEDVPMEAASADATGLSDASSTQVTPQGADAPVTSSFHGDQGERLKAMQAVLANPQATDQQKQDAQAVIDGIQAQMKKQGDLNAKDVEGKTRKRTPAEARQAAFDETAGTDAGAFMAGTSMWKDAMNSERKDREDAQAVKDKQLDRESYERRTGMQVEQRANASAAETDRKTQADRERTATAQARIEALAGGKGAKATAMMQNYNFMVDQMGKSPEEAQRLLFQAKDSSELEKVFKILMHDKYGELTPEAALAKVRGIETATGGTPSNGGANLVRTWNPKTRKFE